MLLMIEWNLKKLADLTEFNSNDRLASLYSLNLSNFILLNLKLNNIAQKHPSVLPNFSLQHKFYVFILFRGNTGV